MVERSNRYTDKETLSRYPNLKVGVIVRNKYRVIDKETHKNIILTLGDASEENKQSSLILVPSKNRSNDFSTVEFKDDHIISDQIGEDDLLDTLQIAKGALEIILGWQEEHSTISARSMLENINRELSDE